MALLCSRTNSGNYSGKLKLNLYWSVSSQSVSENYSVISLSLYVQYNNPNWSGQYKSDYSDFQIDGTRVNSGRYAFGPGEHYIGSTTRTVYHDPDGTFPNKSFGCYANSYHFNGNSVSGTIYSSSVSRIPRKSAISANNGTMGSSLSFTISAASSSFTHTVTYSCGNASGTINSGYSGGTKYWNIPIGLANQQTNGTSIGCTLTCYTYSGGTHIGTTSTTCTLYVPSSTKPSVNSPSYTIHNGLSGQVIQNKSYLTIIQKATSYYGASISSLYTTLQGATYRGASSTTPILRQSGLFNFYSTATDSRGFSSTSSNVNLKVIPYTTPTLSEISIVRKTDDLSNLEIKGIINYNNIKGITYSVSYEIVGKSLTDPLIQTIEANTTEGNRVPANFSKTTTGLELDKAKTYNVILKVTATFDSGSGITSDKNEYNLMVPTEEVTLHLNKNGKGIAIGQYSQVGDIDKEKKIEIAPDWKLFQGKSKNLFDCVPKFKTANGHFNNSTSWIYTNVSIMIPAGCVAILYGYVGYNYAKPTDFCIQSSSTYKPWSNLTMSNYSPSESQSEYCIGIIPPQTDDRTYYLHARMGNSNQTAPSYGEIYAIYFESFN